MKYGIIPILSNNVVSLENPTGDFTIIPDRTLPNLKVKKQSNDEFYALFKRRSTFEFSTRNWETFGRVDREIGEFSVASRDYIRKS